MESKTFLLTLIIVCLIYSKGCSEMITKSEMLILIAVFHKRRFYLGQFLSGTIFQNWDKVYLIILTQSNLLYMWYTFYKSACLKRTNPS